MVTIKAIFWPWLRPDSGLCFEVKFFMTFQHVLSSMGSTKEGAADVRHARLGRDVHSELHRGLRKGRGMSHKGREGPQKSEKGAREVDGLFRHTIQDRVRSARIGLALQVADVCADGRAVASKGLKTPLSVGIYGNFCRFQGK